MKFKIGDMVAYKSYSASYGTSIIKETYIGKIIGITRYGTYKIQFEQDFSHRFGITTLYEHFRDKHLVASGPPLTREQQISLKIKKLWNNSKYVQNNPQQAY